MSNSVAAAYDKAYLTAFMAGRVWFDMVNWLDPVGGALRGSSVAQAVLEQLAPATTALSETSDVTPVEMDDDTHSITIVEYGNAVQTTKYLGLTSFTNPTRMAAEAVGQNQARSLDLVIRAAAVAGSMVVYPGTCAARTDLDTTNDKVSYDFVTQLVAVAASMGVPSFEDGSYAAVIHPLLMRDLQNLAEWKAVGEYSDPKLIYTGKSGVLGSGGRFRNEQGMIAGLRFVLHPYGKLWLSGGTTAQAATTTSADAAAAATAIAVTSASGLAAGDWITLGKGTSTEEMVLITAVSGTDLTVRGAGNKLSNFGLKYAHASGSSVTEAATVAAIPVVGPASIRGRFASEIGKNGQARVDYSNTVIPERFLNHSWYWVGGFAIVPKWTVRGEVAVSGGIYGDNL
jgi:N4-gp56 family major capsid protein